MARSFFHITFRNLAGEVQVSSIAETLRVARKRAKWLATQSFVTSVTIYRGQVGGEVVA